MDTHLLVMAEGLPGRVQMLNASDIASTGAPYRRVFLRDGVLLPGQSIVQTLIFRRPSRFAPPARYTLRFLSGQGTP